jgi:hypothetical protein
VVLQLARLMQCSWTKCDRNQGIAYHYFALK